MKNEWTDEGVREWNRIRAKVDGMRVAGMPFENSPNRLALGPPPPPAAASLADTFPQCITAKIISTNTSLGGGGFGAGRYNVAIGTGAVVKLDKTSNFRPPDSAMTFPSTANAVWTNLFEGGGSSAGTAVLAVGAIVFGYAIGQDRSNPALPAYYGTSAPAGTIFRVRLSQNGGSNGSATTPPTFTYDVYSLDSLQLLSSAGVERPRFSNGFATAATMGTAYISISGAIVLAEAWEVWGNNTCTEF